MSQLEMGSQIRFAEFFEFFPKHPYLFAEENIRQKRSF